MQLIIELQELEIIEIIEGTVKKLLKYSNESYVSNGELSYYLQQRTKQALNHYIDRFDIESYVAKICNSCFNDIVSDTVNKEIEKIVKNKIKEMKNKGELNT